MISNLKQKLISLRKLGGDVVDLFKPRNDVEIIIRKATTGEIHKRMKGRNIVTGFLGVAPFSGRDVMRRLLIPPTDSNSAQNYSHGVYDNRIWVAKMEVGTGGNAEQASDQELDGDTSNADAVQNITSWALSSSDTYITFTATWDDTVLNGLTLKEVVLLSNRTSPSPDFLARKTFQAFTKTDEFTFEVRWTLRF